MAGAPRLRPITPFNDLRAPDRQRLLPSSGHGPGACQHEQHRLACQRHFRQISCCGLLTCVSEEAAALVLDCPARDAAATAIHLENMLALSRMGAVILPPDPAFYLQPATVDDIVKYVVSKVLVSLGIDETLPEDQQYRGES